MTAIARFYNKFLSFIKLDPARPDPTCGSTRPRATLFHTIQPSSYYYIAVGFVAQR